MFYLSPKVNLFFKVLSFKSEHQKPIAHKKPGLNAGLHGQF